MRAESMAAAAQQGRPHGMLSVVGLSDADVASVCEEARAKAGGADTVCQLANMLFPQVRLVQPTHQTSRRPTSQPIIPRITAARPPRAEPHTHCAHNTSAQGRVISGHVEALEAAEQLALGRGALKAARLAVGGAFHTPLMEPARLALLEVLGQVRAQLLG